MSKLEDRTPTEKALGSTPDISQYCQFDWYEPVFYWDVTATFPNERKCLGRWLGVAENYTDLMAFHILKPNGEVIVRKDVWAIPTNQLLDDSMKEHLADYDARLRSKIGDHLDEIDPILADQEPIPDFLFEDEVLDEPEEPEAAAKNADQQSTPEAHDQWLTAKVLLERGGPAETATVIGRKRDQDGVPIGRANSNPLLDTQEYEVECADGTVQAVTANVIAEAIYSQVDDYGRSYTLLQEITDHHFKDDVVKKEDGWVTNRLGVRKRKVTTKGVEFTVEWRDGSTSRIALKDLKESNPVEVAEYAVANKIDDEPAYAWWVRDVLKRRDRVIKKLKTRKVWQETMKFGIELPSIGDRSQNGDYLLARRHQQGNGDRRTRFRVRWRRRGPGQLPVCALSHGVRRQNGSDAQSTLCCRRPHDRSPEGYDILERGITR
jgi:hypothetical protein